MRVAARVWGFSSITFLTLSAQIASANCHLYLAQGGGFSLALKTPKKAGNECKAKEIDLELLVGGKSLTIKHSLQVSATMTYTVTAVLTNTEVLPDGGNLQSLTLSSGSAVETTSMNAVYTPASGTIAASYELDAPGATADYQVRQLSLSMSGIQHLDLQPNGGNPINLHLIDLAQGPAPWFAALPNVKSPFGTTTVTVSFLLDATYPIQFQAYIDEYGQAIDADWPGKISNTNPLKGTIAAEQTWLKANKGPSNIDRFGGLTGGWTDTPKHYYYADTHNGRSLLISPLGNPLFYLGVTSVDAYSTPVTPRDTRASFFESLPSTGDALFKTAYGASNTTFSFIVANQLQKYCVGDEKSCTLPVSPPSRAVCPTSPCTLTNLSDDLESVRLASWAFSGEGKFFGQEPLVQNPVLLHPSFPVLQHDATKLPQGWPAVANLVSHPDPFDSGTVAQLDAALIQQIGTHATDQNVVGWSMGNEKDEIIATSEIETILQMAGTVPAKQSLMNQALNEIYKGSFTALDAAWGISAKTVQQMYDSTPNTKKLEAANGQPPMLDLENLREFYEDAYYNLFRERVKNADPNHLYFGSWILANDPTLQYDWPIAAKYSDVIGFDDFAPGPLGSEITQLFETTGKPVLLGAWGVPTDYGGTRGFGWNQYAKAMTLSDSASGDAYASQLASAAANPHVVGAMVFDYYDEPLTGRGGPGSTGDLVIGENFAFGLLDTTDTPKYDFVNKVRAANCAVLATLGLTTCP